MTAPVMVRREMTSNCRRRQWQTSIVTTQQEYEQTTCEILHTYLTSAGNFLFRERIFRDVRSPPPRLRTHEVAAVWRCQLPSQRAA